MSQHKGFTTWLLAQTNRDDCIGDLARDFAASADASLDEQRLGDGASRAYERALNAYEAVQVFS